MTPELAEVRRWLQKAKNDLLVAQRILQADPIVTDAAGFHCQQSVEKALKAFLVHAGAPFDYIHDLGRLLDLCEQRDASFASKRDGVEPLTPFAVAYRYPGPPDPTKDEVVEALQVAEDVWRFVSSRVPPEALP